VKRAALALLVLALPGGAPAATALPSALAYSRAEAEGGGVFVLERSGRTRVVAAAGVWPSWSPDGRRLAFVEAGDVHVVDADGRHKARVTRTPDDPEGPPDWSPDGRRLVVERAGQLAVLNANGRGERRLGEGREPAWSPAGGRIAFVSDRAGNPDLYLVGTNGRGLRRVIGSPVAEASPAWAPDGRRLAYLSYEAGSPNVRVLDLRTGAVTRVTESPGEDRSPAWTPDGRGLVFASNRGGTDALWLVRMLGTAPVPLGGPPAVERLRLRPPASRELPPDLDQRPPFDLSLRKSGRRFLLGFGSATDNLGPGPVSIVASRSSRAQPTLKASQRIRVAGGGARTYAGVGFLRYDVSPSHSHWHLMDFQRYELRRASDHALVTRDRKSGFCLTDRWTNRFTTGLPGQPRRPRYTTYCGSGNTGAMFVGQGTSVGYTDLYPGYFHGQNLDVTRVAAGVYVLVHLANPELRLREARYDNNAGSIRIRLSWPRGRSRKPAVRVLARCATTEWCEPR
jgi:hypothetical protein